MKISLCLIVKPDPGEAKKLDKCLASCAEFFDEIVITQAGKEPDKRVSKVIKKYNGKETFFEWNDDFSAARNYNFSCATGDWIFWLDADDVLKNPENLKKNIELADQNNVKGLSVLYYYKVKDGLVMDKHWKVQAVKNDGHAEWKGVIHEDLLPKRVENWASINDVIRVHTADDDDSKRSLERNIKILEKAIKSEPNEPRHYFYMARCYLGTEEWEKVLQSVKNYLALSNWKEERYDAVNMAGEAYMRLGMLDDALTTYNDAILELENAPDAYIYKARIYIQKEEWQNAITCLAIAETRDKEAPILKRDALYDHDLFLLAAVAKMHLGKYKDAVECAERAVKNRNNPQAKETLDLAKTLAKQEEVTQHYLALCKEAFNDKQRVQAILATVPNNIKDDPRILAYQFGAVEPVKWGNKSVVVYCGQTVEAWDGNSVKNGGIGGSETAVIEITKRLAQKGWEVVVFCRCDAPPEGKVIDGVTYKNYWQFNKEDEFNVLWAWRLPSLLRYNLKANKILVDAHDVMSDDNFPKDIVEKMTYLMAKSNYHRSLYPSVPDGKVQVIGNGIDLDRFKGDVKKNKNKFIYTSTQNRGLEQVCQMWPEIKKAIPEAELHTFYGWNTYFEMNKNNPANMAWMKHMQQLLSQEGIVNHGRVNQTELAEHQMEAGFWLYPTAFPEIHCITALEMQAAKVYPITSGFAALKETQQSGIKIDGDIDSPQFQKEFIDAIVKSHQSYENLALDKGYKYAQDNSWDKVTDQWESIMSKQ